MQSNLNLAKLFFRLLNSGTASKSSSAPPPLICIVLRFGSVNRRLSTLKRRGKRRVARILIGGGGSRKRNSVSRRLWRKNFFCEVVVNHWITHCESRNPDDSAPAPQTARKRNSKSPPHAIAIFPDNLREKWAINKMRGGERSRQLRRAFYQAAGGPTDSRSSAVSRIEKCAPRIWYNIFSSILSQDV